MSWVSAFADVSLSLLLGALLVYVSLVAGCLVAIEPFSERRLPLIALISRVVEMLPALIAALASFSLPGWAVVFSSTLAILIMIPLLGLWGGFNVAKAIYIVVIASLINLGVGLVFAA